MCYWYQEEQDAPEEDSGKDSAAFWNYFSPKCFSKLYFSLNLFDGLGHRNLKSLLSKNIQLDTWWLLSSCIKVHLFCNSNVLQHDYILHRKYFNLLIFVPFISSLLTIVIWEKAKNNRFYLFTIRYFVFLLCPLLFANSFFSILSSPAVFLYYHPCYSW